MNVADSDEMGAHLKARGFQEVADLDSADAALVNTCTVRDMAEHKASSYIGSLEEWKDANPSRLIIVAGCAVEHSKGKWEKRFPHVDLFVGAKEIDQFSARLDEVLSSKQNMDALIPSEQSVSTLSPVSQGVTIMRGCNYNCSYCIVPSVRGRESYRPVPDILSEVKRRVDAGAKEIWLLGQTVNSYKPSLPPRGGYDFSDLLRDVNAIPGLERIRFTSPHPYYMTERLIQAMAESSRVCEAIHLPVQSGSSKILKAMKRSYTRDSFLASLRRLRELIPSIVISTDLIAGYPGETEDDFRETMSLIEEADFDSAYCFGYSPRPGTASAQEADDVPTHVKQDRLNALLDLTNKKGTEKARALLHSVQEVLIEDDKGEGLFRGKTRGAWRARIKNQHLKCGQIVKVKITGTHSRELHGECV